MRDRAKRIPFSDSVKHKVQLLLFLVQKLFLKYQLVIYKLKNIYKMKKITRRRFISCCSCAIRLENSKTYSI